MKVFVTGATGVVGRRLVPLLRREGHQVTAIARSAAGRERLAQQGALPIELDLFDAAAVRRAIAAHEAVVNLATHIPKPSRIFFKWAWRENDRLRRDASAIVANACALISVPRLIQESFAPAYPDRGTAWIDETTPLATVSYNRTTDDAEASALRFTQSGGTGIILRFGGFYGPDALQTLEFIKWIKKGWAVLPGRPDAYISSISHDDAATAVVAALALPPGIYNVADDDPVTHRELVDSLAAAVNVSPPKLPPQWVTGLLGSLGELLSRSVRISNAKLRSLSRWVPAYPTVREGWRSVVGSDGSFLQGVPAPGSADRF